MTFEVFNEITHENGVLVLLLPDPYIYVVWDIDDIPAWIPCTEVLLHSIAYFVLAHRFFGVVAAQILPYIGRPIVTIQLENKFVAYSDDDDYMHFLRQEWERCSSLKPELMLFTNDKGGFSLIQNGSPFTYGSFIKTFNLESRRRTHHATTKYSTRRAYLGGTCVSFSTNTDLASICTFVFWWFYKRVEEDEECLL